MSKYEPPGFAKAQSQAERYAGDKRRSNQLLGEMLQKAVKHRGQIKGMWTDLMALYRMLRAWTKGDYRAIPWKSIVLALAAILYFVNPFDLAPDFLPVVEYLDDAVVLGFVMNSLLMSPSFCSGNGKPGFASASPPLFFSITVLP
ncbi:MAG: YkvA family protein [Terriglobia bacterium]